MKRIIKLSLTLLMIFGMVACQTTPEESAVQQKDASVLMEKIASGEISEESGENQLFTSDKWEETINIMDGTVTVNFNAKINAPQEMAYPVIQIKPVGFDMDDFYTIQQTFFEGQEIYGLGERPKEYLEELILKKKQWINDPESNFNTTNRTKAQYKSALQERLDEIDQLEAEYLAAPTWDEIEPITMTDKILRMGPILAFQTIAEPAENSIPALYICATEEYNYRNNFIEIQTYESQNLDMSKWAADDTGFLTPPPIKTSKQEIIRQAEALIKSLGIEGMVMSSCELSLPDNDTCRIVFSKEYNGVAVNYTNNDVESDGATLYTHPWPAERIEMAFNDNGLLTFLWQSPSEEVEILSDNIELLAFEKIQDIARNQLSNRFKWGEDGIQEKYATEKRVVINEIRLGMMRVSIPNRTDEYMVIPVWDFYGDYALIVPAKDVSKTQFLTNEDGEGEFWAHFSDQDYSLLTVNAIDGSIIDRSLGY